VIDVLSLVLAAPAVAPVVPVAPALPVPEWTLWVALLLLAGPRLLDSLIKLFGWSAQRNVAHEDAAKTKLESRLTTVETKLNDVERSVERVQHAQQNQRESLDRGLGNIEGKINALDQRVAGQGKYYEEKLKEAMDRVSTDLNRKVATTLAADIPQLVREVLREELDRGAPPPSRPRR